MTLVTDPAPGQPGGTPPTPAPGNPPAPTPTDPPTPAPSPAPTPAPGDPPAASWRDQLHPDLKDDAAFSTFTDINALARSYKHGQGLIGKKGVIVPGEQATEEDMNAFYKSIGRPDLDKYELKTPEGRELHKDLVGKFKEFAHGAGLLPKQAQQILDKYTEFEAGLITTAKTEATNKMNDGLAGLKTEWGDGYVKNINFAKAAIAELGGDELKGFLHETKLGNNPHIIKMLTAAGKLLGEDKLRGDFRGEGNKTPQEIDDAIAKIRNDMAHPYNNASHPGHKAAVDEVARMQKARYPENK